MRRGQGGNSFSKRRRNLRRGQEYWARPHKIGWRMDLRRGHSSGIEWLLRRWICSSLAMLAVLSIARADDLADCNAAATQPNEGIAACTRMIGAGALRGHELAVAYRNRGAGHYTRHEDDEAIADFARAIALDPNYASAYRGRGRALRRKDEPQRRHRRFQRSPAAQSGHRHSLQRSRPRLANERRSRPCFRRL